MLDAVSLCLKASRRIQLYNVLFFFVLSLFSFFQFANAATLPPGFQETVIFSGLTNPTAIRFSPDGRVFVAEKGGRIKVFDSVNDGTPDVFADLNVNVYNFWDRGLLGLALHPNFPATPYVYVLYSYDAEIGQTAPKYGTPGVYSDPCPTPPGPTADGCVVSARLSRLQAAGNFMTGSEQVFLEDWCQQYPSHSIGAMAFGADGALYVSGGDGASFNFTDYGQDGTPLNPCGDPPSGVGGIQTPPTAEGGALRSQDIRTSGDPAGLSGSILRIDPITGQALPNNPMASSQDPNVRRIIAYGLRNPFRFAVRPNTNEIWVGDVGWGNWEEIDRIINPIDSSVENFGWPCYEGNNRQSGYDNANLNICENLYGAVGSVTNPYFTYAHTAKVVANETCPTGSSSIAGLAFYSATGPYPANYFDALFFADYSRDCIWAMQKGSNGLPNPASIITFAAGATNPVDIQISASGELFYADFDLGTIRRIRFSSGNQPPVAIASANPTSGSAPLTVNFNGSTSSDPDAGDTISFAWDLDGDGLFDESNSPTPTFVYSSNGTYTATLKVTDTGGLSHTDSVLITVSSNRAPTATILTPPAGTLWEANQLISFSGRGTDPEQGTLPASALSWSLILQHCPSNCHPHPLQTWIGVAHGTFTAPDHEYPSHLELRLTARDAQGATNTASLILNPRTVVLTFKTRPGGLQLTVGSASQTTTFTRTVIVGSRNSVSAPSPQPKGGNVYLFGSWSDGGAQVHDIFAPATATTYTANYVRQR